MMAQLVASTFFFASLAAGVVTDIRSRRVPNMLVLWLLWLGAVGALTHLSRAMSPTDAVLGGLAGLGLWLPFWLLGLLGAGDVKYFAAASVWVGAPLAWRAALLAALLGGVMSVAVLVFRRGMRQTLGEIALQARHASVILADADAGNSDAKQRTFPFLISRRRP